RADPPCARGGAARQREGPRAGDAGARPGPPASRDDRGGGAAGRAGGRGDRRDARPARAAGHPCARRRDQPRGADGAAPAGGRDRAGSGAGAGGGDGGLAEDLRAIAADQRAVDGDLGRLVASIHEIDLGATECRVRREELAQEAWRAYGVDEAALAARHDPAGDLETVRGRIVELEAKVAAIGPVNLVADDEYR